MYTHLLVRSLNCNMPPHIHKTINLLQYQPLYELLAQDGRQFVVPLGLSHGQALKAKRPDVRFTVYCCSLYPFAMSSTESFYDLVMQTKNMYLYCGTHQKVNKKMLQ